MYVAQEDVILIGSLHEPNRGIQPIKQDRTNAAKAPEKYFVRTAARGHALVIHHWLLGSGLMKLMEHFTITLFHFA